ncbi:DNA-processing protein DprA [Actinoplanes sp. NPDC051859]|uniref:DNA-processing protein DprA n=1 Tax=Actinoplanes sp. NPDC051859 TaxID=3363909 RepID=UPI0037997988
MTVSDDTHRDVRAGLSSYVGRTLPRHLSEVAQRFGARIGSPAYPQVDRNLDETSNAEQELRDLGRALRERAAEAQIEMLIPGDDGWPTGTGCDELPCLWVQGDSDIAGLLHRAVTVTGSRACSEYGRRVACDLAEGLADGGWSLVTSLGHGVDAYAADAALADAGARLVVVTADGLDTRHAESLESIRRRALVAGAVVSAFPPGAEPIRKRILLRNHLLGTLAAASVIVATPPVSDRMLVARAANESGRVVCAVPGPVGSLDSAGCHQLIADGTARLVTCAGDVIVAMARHAHDRSSFHDSHLVRAVIRDSDGTARCQVPQFLVRAASHEHAANTAFDILAGARPDPVHLELGVYDHCGAYEAITIRTGR